MERESRRRRPCVAGATLERGSGSSTLRRQGSQLGSRLEFSEGIFIFFERHLPYIVIRSKARASAASDVAVATRRLDVAKFSTLLARV